MADPVSAGLIIAATVATTVGKIQSDQAAASAAGYNATVLKEQATSASDVAGANMNESIRRSQGELGEQAAAAGEANIGTGGSIAGVEKQSATNARLDALNIHYGGALQRHQDLDAASLQRYQQLLSKSNETSDLIGGGLKAGTQIALGAGSYSQGGTFSGGMMGNSGGSGF